MKFRTQIPLVLFALCVFSIHATETFSAEDVSPDIIIPFTPKERNEHFTEYEMNHVAVKDPKLFVNGEVEYLQLTPFSDSFVFPLKGCKVINPYGGKHTGVDLKTCANDDIVAAFDGIVRLAKPYGGYGNVIVIRHYNGLETIYSHNSKNFVKPGDFVRAGDLIALTGRTGRATTEHLHFEVRINGKHFNPAIIFDFQEHKLKCESIICTRIEDRIIVDPSY